MLHLTEVSVEEFIQGQKFTYETISINVTVFEGISRYEPNTGCMGNSGSIRSFKVLLVSILLPVWLPMGQRAMKALGWAGFPHMNWFSRAKERSSSGK